MSRNRRSLALLAGALLVLLVAVPVAVQAVVPLAPPTPTPVVLPTMPRAPTPNTLTPVPTPPRNVPTPDLTALAPTIEAIRAGQPTSTPRPPSPTPVPGLAELCRTPVPAGPLWAKKTTLDGSLTFEYPANWAVVEETPGLGPLTEPQTLYVFIVSTLEQCAGFWGQGRGKEGFFHLVVRVHLHGLRGYLSLDDRLAAFSPADPAVRPTRQEGIIGGGRAIRSRSAKGEVVYFARGDTYYSVSGENLSADYVAVFEEILKRIDLVK